MGRFFFLLEKKKEAWKRTRVEELGIKTAFSVFFLGTNELDQRGFERVSQATGVF